MRLLLKTGGRFLARERVGLRLIAVFTGGLAGAAAEETAEIRRILEVQAVGDLRGREGRVREEPLGLEDDALMDDFTRAPARLKVEVLVEVRADRRRERTGLAPAPAGQKIGARGSG